MGSTGLAGFYVYTMLNSKGHLNSQEKGITMLNSMDFNVDVPLTREIHLSDQKDMLDSKGIGRAHLAGAIGNELECTWGFPKKGHQIGWMAFSWGHSVSLFSAY